MTDPSPLPASYKDDDLVYVDPESRTVIGKVEFSKNDRPKSKPYVPVTTAVTKEGSPRKSFFRKHFPFGTFRSMRRVFRLQGKTKDPEPNKSLEDVLPRALREAYWDWDRTTPPSPPENGPPQA